VVDALPRNAMGKVEKARLRAELSEPSEPSERPEGAGQAAGQTGR